MTIYGHQSALKTVTKKMTRLTLIYRTMTTMRFHKGNKPLYEISSSIVTSSRTSPSRAISAVRLSPWAEFISPPFANCNNKCDFQLSRYIKQLFTVVMWGSVIPGANVHVVTHYPLLWMQSPWLSMMLVVYKYNCKTRTSHTVLNINCEHNIGSNGKQCMVFLFNSVLITVLRQFNLYIQELKCQPFKFLQSTCSTTWLFGMLRWKCCCLQSAAKAKAHLVLGTVALCDVKQRLLGVASVRVITLKAHSQCHYRTKLHCVSEKKHPDIFSCNLNKHFLIWIIFGTDNTQKLGNQKVVYFRTLSKQCFCTNLQNKQTQKLHLFTHCHTIMVAVSKMGTAGLSFVEPGVKVNGKYYRDVLQSQQMLPVIRYVASDNFVFQ